MKKPFYITAAIPYVNAAPHIGHAQEFCQVDVIARYHRLLGEEVLALSGADENALKNVQAAEKAGVAIETFVDQNNRQFLSLTKKLNAQFDVWQRGSDQQHHYLSSQKLWKLCEENGDIYKKSYKGLYCVGCETFYSPDELDEKGECYEHPGKKLDEVEESNYFFRLSKYQDQLRDLIEADKYAVIPEIRKNEVLAFIRGGLKDLSISRSNERAKNWGVPVPGDATQRIYVWFDALNIYQSGIGFGWDKEKYQKWWPADVHVIGKGIARFHAIYWPAFLLSAHLPLPKKLFVHGYINIEGKKMSKTLGNVIDPMDLIERYGTDAVRYYLLREIPSYGDGDYSDGRFKKLYNADLANGLGNLVARVAKLAEQANLRVDHFDDLKQFSILQEKPDFSTYFAALVEFRFNDSLAFVGDKVTKANQLIDQRQPWRLKGEELDQTLKELVAEIYAISVLLQPFLPETAEKITRQFSGEIKSRKALFPRLT